MTDAGGGDPEGVDVDVGKVLGDGKHLMIRIQLPAFRCERNVSFSVRVFAGFALNY